MTTQEDFVLDCSVTMAWCFDEEATAYTDGVRDCLADKRPWCRPSGRSKPPTPP